ncbi:MAG: hypothetical protein Q8J74_07635 [Candidatus Didemnitutus sp.]|nr:hypothetical protein [Candidatus Didemnitutus sp.]
MRTGSFLISRVHRHRGKAAERLWRTVKYNESYLKRYCSQIEAATNLAAFFRFYNDRRPTARSAAMGPPHDSWRLCISA